MEFESLVHPFPLFTLSLLSTSLILIAAENAKIKKVENGVKKLIKELTKRENETLELLVDLMTTKDTLSQKTVLTIIEAARLLAEDAKELYEETGNEKFLKIAERWEGFVEANKKALERVLGYETIKV